MATLWNILVPVNKGWRTSLDIWTNKHAKKNADSGQFLDFIGEKISVHPCSPLFSHSALFISSRLSFCTVFYGSPSLCLYGAIGKYTTSRLIISQPVERSHFFCVVLAVASKKLHQRRWKTVISLAVTLEWCSPRHSASAHHMSGFGVGSAGLELWRRPRDFCARRGGGCGGHLLGHWHLHHIASIWTPVYWLNEWIFWTLWSRNVSLCLLDFEIYCLKHVQVCFRTLSTISGGALGYIPCMLSIHL